MNFILTISDGRLKHFSSQKEEIKTAQAGLAKIPGKKELFDDKN
jgi:hypothetical protein